MTKIVYYKEEFTVDLSIQPKLVWYDMIDCRYINTQFQEFSCYRRASSHVVIIPEETSASVFL
jgi:hypothetical protein